MDAAPGSLPQPRGAACEDVLGMSNRKIQWVECSGKPGAPCTHQIFILYLNILRLLASQSLSKHFKAFSITTAVMLTLLVKDGLALTSLLSL